MEGAGKLVDDEELAEALKEKGLGTPATRASTIEHLIKEKYLRREGTELFAFFKGGRFIPVFACSRCRSFHESSYDWRMGTKIRQN